MLLKRIKNGIKKEEKKKKKKEQGEEIKSVAFQIELYNRVWTFFCVNPTFIQQLYYCEHYSQPPAGPETKPD